MYAENIVSATRCKFKNLNRHIQTSTHIYLLIYFFIDCFLYSFVHFFIYLLMCVFMYVLVFLFVTLCIDLCLDLLVSLCMRLWIYVWMCLCIYGKTRMWICGFVDLCNNVNPLSSLSVQFVIYCFVHTPIIKRNG